MVLCKLFILILVCLLAAGGGKRTGFFACGYRPALILECFLATLPRGGVFWLYVRGRLLVWPLCL